MAYLGGTYTADPNNLTQEFDIMPPHEPVAIVTESSFSENKKQTGSIVGLVWTITEGEFAGRKVWQYINNVHENPTTQEIGRREFDTVCVALGKISVQDTNEFHGIPARISIGVEKGTNGYKDKNIIKNVKPVGQAGAASSATPAAANSNAASPPWKRAG